MKILCVGGPANGRRVEVSDHNRGASIFLPVPGELARAVYYPHKFIAGKDELWIASPNGYDPHLLGRLIDAYPDEKGDRIGQFVPTHRHADGLLYQVLDANVCLKNAAGKWSRGVRYCDASGCHYVRTWENWSARFTAL